MQNPLQDALTFLQKIENVDLSGLDRKQQLGEDLNLEPVKNTLGKIQNICSRSKQSLDLLSTDELRRFEHIWAEFGSLCARSREFRSTNSNANQERRAIIEGANELHRSALRDLTPALALAAIKPIDQTSFSEEQKEIISKLESEIESTLKEIGTLKDRAISALHSAESAAELHGLTSQSIFFSEVADREEKKAKKWLAATLIIGAIAFAISILGVFSQKIDFLMYNSNEPIVIYLSSKALLFALVIFFLYTSARNFNAHKHNATINRHREAAIKSFQAVAEGAIDGDRSIILTQAAAGIFHPQDTGYLRGSKESGAGASVIEVLRNQMPTS